MMAPHSAANPLNPPWPGLRAAVLVIALAGAAALIGVILASAATRFGPLTVLAVVGALAAMAAVLADVSLAVAGMFLLLPLGLQQAGPLQVIELAALFVVALVAVLAITTGRRWGIATQVAVPLGAVLLVAAISTAGSASPGVSLPALIQLCAAAALMVSIASSVDSLAQLRRLVSVLVVVGAGISISAASRVDEVTTTYGGGAVRGRAEGIFTQPNELGAFTAAVLVLAVGLWVGFRTSVGSLIGFVSVVAVLTALLSSLSRGAWIGAVSGTVAVVVMVSRHQEMRRRLVGLGLALALLALAAPALLGDHPLSRVIGSRISTLLDAGANPNDARPEIYAEALRQIREEPILGRGPGTFVTWYADAVSTGRSGRAEHAHNLALTLAAEVGLLGLTAFAALALAVLVSGWMAVRTLLRRGLVRDAALCAGAVGALVTVLGHGFVDYPLRNPILFLLHWAVAGLVLGYARLALTQRPITGRSSLT